MSINFSSCTEEELWKFVGEHLSSRGFDTVLVGGAVVSIYSDGAYKSGDLDFIVQNLMKDGLSNAMAEIGFKKKGRHYLHPECSHLFVEFPSGPLGIGSETGIEATEVNSNGKLIKILSPTDCIKDRLATYIYFKDQEGLEQAVLVAKRQPFNLVDVEKWCKVEGREDVFKELSSRLRD